MDFFQQQDRARRKSFLMIFLFIAGVVCVFATIELTAYVILSDDLNHPQNPQKRQDAIEFLMEIGAGTLLLIVGSSIYRSWELRRGGGKYVAESLGGRLANPNGDIKERRLLNITEEMALASGMPVPSVYVLDDEPGINAFAAGNSPEDAVVAVTKGALYKLKRDELQGVIGHEFSHILNGDMRANIRLMGFIFGIYMIYLIGWMIFRSIFWISDSRDKEKDTGAAKLAIGLLGLWIMLVGSLGLLFVNLMKAAFSRQREYLADASAVQFTRNPQGIANALKRIGGIDPNRQKIRTPAAAEASHLFFSEFSSSFWSSLFATHPPLKKRIMRLDPEFNPELAVQIQQGDAPTKFSSTSPTSPISERSGVSGLAPSVARAEYGASAALKKAAAKEYAAWNYFSADSHNANQKKNPEIANVFPQSLSIRDTIANSLGAVAYVLAILTDRQDMKIAEKQKQLVSQIFGGIFVHDYARLLKQTDSLSPVGKLVNLQLAIPALRQLSSEQYPVVRAGICALIEADSYVELNEFVVYSMVCRQLDIVFGLRKPSTGAGQMTIAMFRSAVLVLSRLAYVGSEIPEEQERAFRVGLETLNIADADLLPKTECSNEKLQKALTMLDRMEMVWKRNFLNAAVQTIQADGKETDDEAILRFGIAAMLGIYA